MSPARGDGVRVAVGPLRVHVDQTHLHGTQGIVEVPVAAVALVAQPLVLGAPVDVVFRFPDVLATAAEAERLEAHRLESAIARKDHQVRPGELLAVLLLDRPQQHSRLVEVGVVRPTVEWRETLVAGTAAAAAVEGSIGAGAVPSHSNEERPVVTVVGGPPVLRRGHQLEDILLEGVEVQRLERFGVVERLVHGVGQG